MAKKNKKISQKLKKVKNKKEGYDMVQALGKSYMPNPIRKSTPTKQIKRPVASKQDEYKKMRKLHPDVPLKVLKTAVDRRFKLIKNQTIYEKALKKELLKRKVKFIFQKIFFTESQYYIVDFYLPFKNIIIELDGKQHDDAISYDTKRSMDLINAGVKNVIRFSNRDIYTKLNQCALEIESYI